MAFVVGVVLFVTIGLLDARLLSWPAYEPKAA